jgi:hypothetical protein
MDSLDHLGWVVEQSYEIADTQFGVRTNSEECAAWLDDAFGAFLIDEPTHSYYSIRVAEETDDGVGKRFHVVYEESRALVKTLHLREAYDCLIAQFEHVAARGRSDAIYVDAGLVTLDGVVALVPPILPPYLRTLSHRVVERAGLTLPVANYVALERGTGLIVDTGPAVRPSADALAALDQIAPSANGPSSPASERLQTDFVCFLGLPEEAVLPYSPGQAAHVLAARILNLPEIGGEALETIAELVMQAHCLEIRSTTPKETLGVLRDLLASVAA